MLSILIPTYNYNVFTLVDELHRQAAKHNHLVEIIVLDDSSKLFLSENKEILQFEHTQLIQLTNNIGRTAARQQLSEKAKYENLLFMDADVLPKNKDFLQCFITKFPFSGLLFGGIEYASEVPDPNQMLRWKYGHARESLSLIERNKNTYETVNSGCFLIKKDIFIKLNTQLQQQSYGMDLLFKQLLKKHKIPVTHLDNPVYHLGLESNEQFVAKALEAVETTVRLENSELLQLGVRPIQKSYITLKKWRLLRVFSLIITPFKKTMEQNFNSSSPNLFWFDLYRLHHYIQLKSKKSV